VFSDADVDESGTRTGAEDAGFFEMDSDERRMQQALRAAGVVVDDIISGLANASLPRDEAMLASDEVVQSELEAIERKNELLRRRLNEAMLACEPAESLPTDLSAAQLEIIALRRGLRQLSDALLEGVSHKRFAEKLSSSAPRRAAAGAGAPLPTSSRGGGGIRSEKDHAPTEAELALELEVQELTHRALSLELEELLRANLARVTSIAGSEPEPEPQSKSQAAPMPTAGAVSSLAAEVALQGKRLDDLAANFADMRNQLPQQHRQQGSSDDAAERMPKVVGFADDTKEMPSKKLVRQQTGIGESVRTVGFADDTKEMPSKKLVRQQTGIGESAPGSDDGDTASAESNVLVAPLPPIFRLAKVARNVRASVGVINSLKDTAKGMGVAASATILDGADSTIHVLPAVAGGSVEDVVGNLECRIVVLQEDMTQVRATLQAALETMS
jgi:hypothetical protein